MSDARGETSFEDNVKEYLQSHDVTFKLPLGGSSVTVGARNLDDNELNFNLKFSDATGVQEGLSSLILIFLINTNSIINSRSW